MAEVIGAVASGITLAGLFKACCEAFDLVVLARNQEADFKRLVLKLRIEQSRLYAWGETVGFTESRKVEERSADFRQSSGLVSECLTAIISLFEDSKKMTEKYGCKAIQKQDLERCISLSERSGILGQFSTAFSSIRMSLTSTVRKNRSSIQNTTFWVIHDRKKFQGLVSEAQVLINGLQDITRAYVSHERQDSVMRLHILSINDAETLDTVAEVCKVDHPEISDAATAKTETLSMPSGERQIERWRHDVHGDNFDDLEDDDSDGHTITVDTAVAAVEDMQLAEIKHTYISQLIKAQDDAKKTRQLAEQTSTFAQTERDLRAQLNVYIEKFKEVRRLYCESI